MRLKTDAKNEFTTSTIFGRFSQSLFTQWIIDVRPMPTVMGYHSFYGRFMHLDSLSTFWRRRSGKQSQENPEEVSCKWWRAHVQWPKQTTHTLRPTNISRHLSLMPPSKPCVRMDVPNQLKKRKNGNKERRLLHYTLHMAIHQGCVGHLIIRSYLFYMQIETFFPSSSAGGCS